MNQKNNPLDLFSHARKVEMARAINQAQRRDNWGGMLETLADQACDWIDAGVPSKEVVARATAFLKWVVED